MAYDSSKLIIDVRIKLGGISEVQLPDDIITYYGDFYDTNPSYTDNYPLVFWKSTLACLDYLKAGMSSSTSNAAKTSRKEKVGDVEVTISSDNSSSSSTSVSYDDLYEDYSENPWKFGVETVASTGSVLFNGVNQATVDKYRNNRNTTGIYSPLPATAFPKDSNRTYRRGISSGGRR